MEATAPPETKTTSKSKGRASRSNKYSSKVKGPSSESRTPQPAAEDAPKAVTRDDVPEPPVEDTPKSITKDGVPVISARNPDKPSEVHSKSPNAAKTRRRAHERVVLDAPPAAREAAFSGPPRYDWIDIETAAAIKVQSVARRNKVMSELEAEGRTTAAIRNRSRRRNARGGATASDDAPGLFQCCGVGLIFGDATEEDYETSKEREREAYEEKKRTKAAREAQLRQYRPRARKQERVEESLEIVE